MNAVKQPASFGRRFLRWFLISVGVCLLPILALAVVAASCLSLNSDSRALRKHVMAATDADWDSKVQLSIGRGLIGTAGAVLSFIDKDGVDDARIALRAVKHASVGVYERTSPDREWSREALFVKTDKAMAKRGWTRMVGVADGKDTVLIYVPTDADNEDQMDICVAVVSGKDLVIASTRVDAGVLMELAMKHSCDDVKKHVRIAGLKF
ncbi:hypothetical protein [Oleiharenicola lentus]|uniref:hypothetical protein n=1 Tax=Oleiharenicola lentus TaxID=2508720 RepID=UPI003F662B10